MRYLGLLLLLLLPYTAVAGVNHMNGNFYISYTDIHLDKAPAPLEITRTYNSMSVDTGWFGTGWGSNYETSLTVAPEGSVLIRENGNGARVWFTPEKGTDLDGSVERIVAEMRKKGTVADDAARAQKDKLKSDADLRLRLGQQYGVKAEVPVGTVLRSAKLGVQELRRAREGFVRTSEGGDVIETFSDNGQLVRVSEKGRTVEITYLQGRAQSIADNHGQKVLLEWTPDGFVKSLGSSGQKARASYRYQGRDLTESVDVDSNRYAYTYDDRHNLTSIGYRDGRKMLIEYDAKSSFATRVTEKDGKVTEYNYGANPQNPDLHYWTEIIRSVGDEITLTRYEYEYRLRSDGTKYAYRTVTEMNGEQTETIFSEKSEAPLKIVRRDRSVEFEYDSLGNLIRRETSDGRFSSLEYHPILGKVSRVENNDGWSAFSYDAAGNLIQASNKEGARVDMGYDSAGRITTLIDYSAGEQQKKTISVKYNNQSKPTEIAVAGLGAISVNYDVDGNVAGVDSPAGTEMVQQVLGTMSTLLAIVEPSGVKLGL